MRRDQPSRRSTTGCRPRSSTGSAWSATSDAAAWARCTGTTCLTDRSRSFLAAAEPSAPARDHLIEARRSRGSSTQRRRHLSRRRGVRPAVPGVRADLRAEPRRAAPAVRALELVLGIARGLSAAHRRDVLHRDIKPANVMLSEPARSSCSTSGLPSCSTNSRRGGWLVARAEPAVSGPGAGGRSMRRPQRTTRRRSATASAGRARVRAAPGAWRVTHRHRLDPGNPAVHGPELWRGEPATVQSDVYVGLRSTSC
jgi:serine/threonine protein kinase